MAKVYVGMSGGVDSSLSAALLAEAGHQVTGVYMKNWSQDLPGMKCPWAEDLADAKRVAVQLGIPFRVYDFETQYKQLVVDYMIAEYQRGRTPNPDIMCNQEVKFGLFLQAALADGAEMIATGHYARVKAVDTQPPTPAPQTRDFDSAKRVLSASQASDRQFNGVRNSKPLLKGLRARQTALGEAEALAPPSVLSEVVLNSEHSLFKAKDPNKDQTYFLYRVTAAALGKTIFPIGDLTKPQVRAAAKRRGLLTAERRDSQGICFVGNVGIRQFLSQYVQTRPGDIIEQETGKVLGRHDGAIFYTFGQRHSLGVGGGLPYYVVGKDMTKNHVYVSHNLNHPAFWRDKLRLEDVHWINQPPMEGKKYQVRLRHRGELLDCRLDSRLRGNDPSPLFSKVVRDGNDIIIKLSQPERAAAAGQSAVIYDGDRVLGGGIITNRKV